MCVRSVAGACPVEVPSFRVQLAAIAWLTGVQLCGAVPSALRRSGQTPPVTPRKYSPSSTASSLTPRRHSSGLHAVNAIAGASSPGSSPRTPRTNKSDGRCTKRSVIAAAAELAISQDLLSADDEGGGVDGAHPGHTAHARRAQKARAKSRRGRKSQEAERGMFSAAWGAVLPRTGPVWKVPGPWATDGQATSARSPAEHGGIHPLSIPSIPMVPALQIPGIPLHLISPPDLPDRNTDNAGEDEGGYSRRSALQKSALLDAIGEDSVRVFSVPHSFFSAAAPSRACVLGTCTCQRRIAR